MCLFHKWSKWEQYVESGTALAIGIAFPKDVRGKMFDYTEVRQKRRCEKCGKIQDEKIKDGGAE